MRELAEADGLVISEGTIYPLLTRLRKDQHVTTFWQESDSGPRAATTGSLRPARPR